MPGLAFGIRAWRGSDAARVVVYAVLDDKRALMEEPNRYRSSVAGARQSVEIAETRSGSFAGVRQGGGARRSWLAPGCGTMSDADTHDAHALRYANGSHTRRSVGAPSR